MKVRLAVVILLFSVGTAAAQGASCNQAQSKQEVQRYIDAGTIISVSQFLPYITVTVDERSWSRLSAETKKALGQQVDCATVGPDNKMLRTVVFRANKTNQVLGKYTGGQFTPE
jgi:hypothetical protein